MYALLLTENIYAVAANRTIQLVRGCPCGRVSFDRYNRYFLIGTVFGLRLPFLANGIMVTVILWPLFLKGAVVGDFPKKYTPTILMYSTVLSLIGGEIAMFTRFFTDDAAGCGNIGFRVSVCDVGTAATTFAGKIIYKNNSGICPGRSNSIFSSIIGYIPLMKVGLGVEDRGG